MKKLLLMLSMIALPLIGAISWNKDKKMYCSTSVLWGAKLDEKKYHTLASIANECIGSAMCIEGNLEGQVMLDLIEFLKAEDSPEAFILLMDLRDLFLEGD